MKIETIDMAPPPPEPQAPMIAERGLVGRAVIVAVLAVFMMAALRWAVDVTNANAKQLSTNLSSLQGRIEQHESPSARASQNLPSRPTRSNDGPTLEAVDDHN